MVKSCGNTQRDLLTKKGTEGKWGDPSLLSPFHYRPMLALGQGSLEGMGWPAGGWVWGNGAGGSQPQNLISFPKPVFWAALPCQVSA